MKYSLLRRITLAVGLVAPLAPLPAQWSVQPDGEWGYTHNLTTEGVFRCLNVENYLPGGSCSASGNTLTLVSGSSSMTISFTGTTQTVIAKGTRSGPLEMGMFTKSFTGGPFSLPPVASVNGALFQFEMLLKSTLPFPTSASIRFGYTSRTGNALPNDCCQYPTYTILAALIPPEPLRYSGPLYDTFAGVNISLDQTPNTITSRVGLVPEPETIALLASGLGMLGIVRVLRRRDRPI